MSKMDFWRAGGGSRMLMGWLGKHMFVCGVRWEMGVGMAEGEVSGETVPQPGRKWCDGQWEGSARLRHSQGARSQENSKKEDKVCPQPLRPGLQGPRAEAMGEVTAWGQRPV